MYVKTCLKRSLRTVQFCQVFELVGQTMRKDILDTE